jgi:predicted  nucleic acid-binding Zn-ribbon protein
MNRAFKLLRVQQVDSQLDEVRGRLAEIERILNEDEKLRAAQHSRAQAEAELREAHKQLREAEEQVKAQQEHIQQNQAALYGGKVTNPKELQDLQKEAESLARQLSTLEDEQLTYMAGVEEKQAGERAAIENLEGLLAQQAVEQRALHSEQSGLREKEAQLAGEREPALSGVDAADLEIYEGLRKTKKGLAVARVENHTCSACGAELSAALAQAAKSPSELARCATCKRILYGG